MHKDKAWLNHLQSAQSVIDEMRNQIVSSAVNIMTVPLDNRGYMCFQQRYHSFRCECYRIVSALPQIEQDAVNILLETKKVFSEQSGIFSKASFLRLCSKVPYRSRR